MDQKVRGRILSRIKRNCMVTLMRTNEDGVRTLSRSNVNAGERTIN